MASSGFSSILKLADLDDFITPSQECIKPAQQVPKRIPSIQPTSSKIKIELENDGTIDVPLVSQKVEINLTDCLACSGCITSAESILISQQSPEELVRILERNKNKKSSIVDDGGGYLAVITLGTQAVLSLARKYELEPQDMAERLSGFFKNLGADKVIPITLAEDLCLIESEREFMEKCDLVKTDPTVLPIISGVCPGWVCYAEKLHPYALKNISKVKSPQQIMGSLLKSVYGPRVNRSPDEIYHVTLMSCFDRKLEASRKDFSIEEYKSKEVDSVITPLEVENLLDSIGKTLLDFEPLNLDNLFGFNEIDMGDSLMSHLGSGSGGFAEFVLRSTLENSGQKSSSEVEWVVGRNPDISEATITTPDGDLKFSVATGFRNIQTIVRKLKTKMRSNMPHYIEIMACPSGCLNGGAQLRSQEQREGGGGGGRELANELEKNYKKLPLESKKNNLQIEQIYGMLGSPDSKLYNEVLYTEFHAIEKQASLGIKW